MTTKLSWHRIFLMGSGLSLFLVTAVQAHENHDHSKRAEPNGEAPVTDAQSADTLPTTSTETDASSTPTEEPQVVESVQTTAQPIEAATQTGLPGTSAVGLNTIGLGEPLLGLIIAGPFLLISLKKRLQS